MSIHSGGTARGLSLAGGLAGAAAASILTEWLDAARVLVGARPPVGWAETSGLAIRGALPLCVATGATAILVWAVSLVLERRSRAEIPRAASHVWLLLARVTAGWAGALAVLIGSGFDVKSGWIAAAALAGCAAGEIAGRFAARRADAAGSSAPANGKAALLLAGIALAVWIPSGLTAAKGFGTPEARLQPRSTGRPNILFIVVDALRADHLGAYGYSRPVSPAIDAFAARSVRFDRVTAPSTWTLPAMASILTSSHPGRHGVVRRGDGLPGKPEDLVERLHQAGYATAAFAPNPWLKRAFGFYEGFDAYYDIDRLGLARLLAGVRLKNLFLRRLGRIRVDPELVDDAPDLTRRALGWLSARGDRPFFLYLHFMDVHSPYDPPAPYHGMFCTGHRFNLPDHLLEARFRSGKLRADAAVLAHVVELYDESIRALDDSIRDLLSGLRRMGLDTTTAVVLTADHGEEFLDHGGTMHGKTLYEEVARVPLIWGGPGASEPRVVTARVSTLDLLPTFLDMAGVAPDARLAGASLLPVIEGTGGVPRDRPLGSQLFYHGRTFTSLYTGDLKIIRSRPLDAATAGDARVEVYKLSEDPGEHMNLASADAGQTARLTALLDGVESSWGSAGAGRGRPGTPIDPETLRQLEALGYVN